jgi:hypothetical protein
MKSNKFRPDFIGETRTGTYYVAPYESLKADYNLTTIWLDLETKKGHFYKKAISAYNCPVIRVSLGKKDDFTLYINRKFKPLFEIFKNISPTPIPIPQMIEIILNPQILGEKQQQLVEDITHLTKNLTQEDRKDLIKFHKFVQNLKTTDITKLLNESKYTLIFGNLSSDDKFNNNVATQTEIELKQQNLTLKDIEEVFGGIILDDKIFTQVFTSLGLQDICSKPPKPPKTGGAIFIDMGGTGKTLMKDALKKLWINKLGGECIEKNGIAEFSKAENYAALIGSWYHGYEGKEEGYDKKGLVKAANENKVPSLLIIDEADRFIRDSKSGYQDQAAELIIIELKRHLNKSTQSKVLTIFIANVDEKDLNPQLKQGGTRLTSVYFGPPKNQKDWIELIDMYIRESKLQFENRTSQYDKLLANLILEHNKNMPHEKYMIVPRKFGPNFCNRYLNNYSKDDTKENTHKGSKPERLFSILHKKETKEIIIQYEDFLKHFIDDYLLKEVELAGLNVQSYRQKYYDFINFDLEREKDEDLNEQEKARKELEKAEINLILSDNDTKRIIKAEYSFEILNVNANAKKNEILEAWRNIHNKFVVQGGDNYKLGNKFITSDLGKELLENINKKINNVSRENIQLKIKDEYNWDEYYNYINKSRN